MKLVLRNSDTLEINWCDEHVQLVIMTAKVDAPVEHIRFKQLSVYWAIVIKANLKLKGVGGVNSTNQAILVKMVTFFNYQLLLDPRSCALVKATP